jgi:predicted MFS family arabinose efflux permease
MDVDTNTRAKNPLSLLQSPVIILGMAAVSVFFMGQFALFTYVRPFLETVTQVGVGSLSFILLLIGVAGFAGTALVGVVIKDSVYPALIGIPVVMAVIAVLLTVFGLSVAATGFLLALWGFFATSAPVVWWTWLAKSLPHDAEAGGGLMVAVIQFAITAGAAIGGSLVDHGGYRATFVASAAILVLGALLAAAGSKLSRRS